MSTLSQSEETFKVSKIFITNKDLKINGNTEIILKNVQKQTPEALYKKSLRPATFLKKRL